MRRAWLITGLLLAPIHAPGMTSQQATNAIVGEAAGSPYVVKLGVAEAIRHRGTLRGVYGFNSPVTRKSSPKVWAEARSAWLSSAKTDITHGATHFGNADDVRKGTFAGMKLLCVLGTGKATTYFFKP